MSRKKQELGQEGEEIAARYLEARGYRVLARRYRTRLGELDLVASWGEELVFVEVKARRGSGFGAPAESVRGLKQARIRRVAEQFLADHRRRAGREPICRFDVIAITWGPDGRHRVEHLEDAFRPPGC